MSRLATDRPLHSLIREFVIAVNRLDNADARGADSRLMSDLMSVVNSVGGRLEEALVQRGWTRPGAQGLRVVSDGSSVVQL
jgi:hypothetical protein